MLEEYGWRAGTCCCCCYKPPNPQPHTTLLCFWICVRHVTPKASLSASINSFIHYEIIDFKLPMGILLFQPGFETKLLFRKIDGGDANDIQCRTNFLLTQWGLDGVGAPLFSRIHAFMFGKQARPFGPLLIWVISFPVQPDPIRAYHLHFIDIQTVWISYQTTIGIGLNPLRLLKKELRRCKSRYIRTQCFKNRIEN